MWFSSRRSTIRRARRSPAPAARLGFGQVTGVRQGKRFELELSGPADDETLAQIGRLAAEVLANPVLEDFSLRTL